MEYDYAPGHRIYDWSETGVVGETENTRVQTVYISVSGHVFLRDRKIGMLGETHGRGLRVSRAHTVEWNGWNYFRGPPAEGGELPFHIDGAWPRLAVGRPERLDHIHATRNWFSVALVAYLEEHSA